MKILTFCPLKRIDFIKSFHLASLNLYCSNLQPELLDGAPRLCNPAILKSCGAGFTCTINANDNLYYCCLGADGAAGNNPFSSVIPLVPQSALCPAGMVSTQPPQKCPGPIGICPAGYNCQFSFSANNYQCCGIIDGNLACKCVYKDSLMRLLKITYLNDRNLNKNFKISSCAFQ